MADPMDGREGVRTKEQLKAKLAAMPKHLRRSYLRGWLMANAKLRKRRTVASEPQEE